MNNRMLRADAEIKRELSEILLYDLSDPRFDETISVTWVKVSPDFTHCKVGVSIVNNDENKRKDIVNLLNKSSGYIKKLLNERVQMRAVPQLVFEIDNGAIFAESIESILEKLEIPKEPLDE